MSEPKEPTIIQVKAIDVIPNHYSIHKWDEMMDVVLDISVPHTELLKKFDAEDAEHMKYRPSPAPDWLKTYPALLRKWKARDSDQLDFQCEIIQLVATLRYATLRYATRT